MARKWDGKIPYDPKTGSVPHTEYSYSNNTLPRKDNHVFHDILTDFKIHRTSTSVYVTAKSNYPERVHIIFLSDFEVMVKLIELGKLNGMFTYRKHGANYGTCLDHAFAMSKLQ